MDSDVPAREINHTLETEETAAILDTEIARLPEKLRRVIVLCYLQNLTAEAAARQLGIPRGTVLSRLDTARRKLQVALTRRGVAPLALLGIPLIHAMPAVALVQATQRAVLEFSSGAVTTPITELATEVLHMTTRKWIAGTALAIMLIAGTTTGVGVFTANGPGTSQVVAQAPTVPTKPPVPKPPADLQKLEILKQLEQLEKTEAEMRMRIDSLSKKIDVELNLHDAGFSAQALIKAIDKIDQTLLEEEEKLPPFTEALAEIKKELRPKKDYPAGTFKKYDFATLDLTDNFSEDPYLNTDKVKEIPELISHIKALREFSAESKRTDRDSKEARDNTARSQKYLDEFKKNISPILDMKILAIQQERYHSEIFTRFLRLITESCG